MIFKKKKYGGLARVEENSNIVYSAGSNSWQAIRPGSVLQVNDDVNFFHFCCNRAGNDYTHFHSKSGLNKKPMAILQDAYYQEGEDYDEFIENVLGLGDEEDRLEFMREYYETYGIERVIDEDVNITEQMEHKGVKYNVFIQDIFNHGGDIENIFTHWNKD